MKILYILNSGNPGGMEQHVLDLVTSMIERGCEVHVWCNEGLIESWYKNAGAHVLVKKIRFDIDPIYIFDLVDYISKEKIEVVHAHELKAVTNATLAGLFAGVKVRISHTHTPISEWKISPFVRRLTCLGYSFLVNVFCSYEVALTESRQLKKVKEGISKSKLVTIPNCVHLDEYRISESQKLEFSNEIRSKYNISPDTLVLGNVSRLTKEKGHDILLHAFSKLLSFERLKHQKVHLFLAGGGELESSMKSLVSSLGLDNLVTITGVFNAEDKLKYYSAFDVFVFPSLAEGFGIVLVEAMAFGLPILCSDLEVLQEVGGSGVMYFTTGDSDDLSLKLADLLLRKDNLNNLLDHALNRVETLYSYQKFGDTYFDLYTRTLEAGK